MCPDAYEPSEFWLLRKPNCYPDPCQDMAAVEESGCNHGEAASSADRLGGNEAVGFVHHKRTGQKEHHPRPPCVSRGDGYGQELLRSRTRICL